MLRRRQQQQSKVQFDCDEVLRQTIMETAPKPIQVSDAASVESNIMDDLPSRFSMPFDPAPLVPQSVILIFGGFIFVLALIWPPLILLVAYMCSKLIPYSFRENDDATSRRQLFHEFSKEDDLPEHFKNMPENIRLDEEYVVNERGMLLYASTLTPTDQPVKAVVCFCHGYTDSASFSKRMEFQRLVHQGIAFVAIEYEGHGRSDGAVGLISDWERLIDDVSNFYSKVATERFEGIPTFLMGESMGGAVAYCTYDRTPSLYRGVVFICPMCKIADEMLPPTWVIEILMWCIGKRGTTSVLGYLPIAPARGSLENTTHKVPEKRRLVSRCPTYLDRNPRLATARELIHVTQRISNNLHEFEAPFLVLHGKEDRVTDPALSVALYEESKSKDKSIRLYDGMWHALTGGETDEDIDMVFADMIGWILKRL
ncbi:hypothetical protein MPSEU_000601700 [Mayamaea pseudoterrestris]|nr:hypothetical protein MPSEU_000601700 [Mayamaea pseudoterrestris]